MKVVLHPHAVSRLSERGATEIEVIDTIWEANNFLLNSIEQDSDLIFPMKIPGWGKNIIQNR